MALIVQTCGGITDRQAALAWGKGAIGFAALGAAWLRLALVLNEALSLVQGGYDLKIGTSERGSKQSAAELELPDHRRALVAFGGPLGLEDGYQKDSQRAGDDVTALFDMWVNTCPDQGSRTIRTEEAVLISLSYLQTALRQ